MLTDLPRFRELFCKHCETISGDTKPFFGYSVSRSTAREIEFEPYEDVLLGESLRPSDVTSGNLLYIPDLGEYDVYAVETCWGRIGSNMEIVPVNDPLVGDTRVLCFSSPTDESGVYESVLYENRIRDLPSLSVFSDDYVAEKCGEKLEDVIVQEI